MNDKTTDLPKPEYSAKAKAVNASGNTDTLTIVVDENGKGFSASSVSGHPLLRNLAKSATRTSTLPPQNLGGKPAQIFKNTGL